MNIAQIKAYIEKNKTNTEAVLKHREELSELIKEAEALLDSINQELIKQLEQTDGKIIVGEKTVRLIERLSFKDVPLEFAKKFRAVKKVVDPTVLKPLYDKGVKMPNVKSFSYVKVL